MLTYREKNKHLHQKNVLQKIWAGHQYLDVNLIQYQTLKHKQQHCDHVAK